ncbi:hypothetical protein GCM10011352_10720 [Marinobacterium zhoushanense]|uniref:DUF4132 domain-containing protein n=1 Tax=Marinobacterium zhoushanense TaxID=1679163 RepID=A0ABQ1K859_9GAMM|nr:DUF4132 domain-containing protein [Marinobacterium zhoushanense]GGB86703.1 hypothetical protein GCM10011352_10720 [Marinobacterium zhoushanense]
MGIFDFLKRDKSGAGSAKDRESASPGSEYQALIERYIAYEVADKRHLYDLKLGDSEAGKAILALDAEQSVAMLMHCAPEYFGAMGKTAKAYSHFFGPDACGITRVANIRERRACYDTVVRALLRRKLPLSLPQLHQLLDGVLTEKHPTTYNLPLSGVMTTVEHYVAGAELDDSLRARLEQLRQRIDRKHTDQALRKIAGRIQALTGVSTQVQLLHPGEAWSDAAIADCEAAADRRDALLNLISQCAQASGSKPSRKWLAGVTLLLDQFGRECFNRLLINWLALVDKPRTKPATRRDLWQPDRNLMMDESNADILKGLIWCASLAEDAELARALVKAALSCFRKVPGVGPRAVRVGNACIYTLAAMPGRSGLYQLAVLKVKIKYRSALNIINKALEEAAAREGISVDALEEMGVPAYGLDSVGYGEEPLGDYTAIISLPSLRQVELSWRNDDGKVQKSVPTRVKEDHAADLKELRGALKDIKAMLGVQRERLEQLFLKERVWPFEVWGERYRDHPLVGVLARNLIWRFSSEQAAVLGIYQDGQLLDSAGEPLTLPAGEVEVSLWHPITSDAVEVQAWRACIERLQVVQPFKQAHREVYLLTDAEINTGVYSNRFASHIIKQHQFNALAATRGWRYTLQGAWDGGDDIARLGLPRFNLWAEFWVQGIGEYGNDTTEAGVFLYVSTDQVRFYRIRTGADDLNEENIDRDTSVDLREVPALVLSEVFRDVDLFVGVCSVGNDPEWSDGGPDGRYHDYWHTFSFGELNASAETRKAILQNLIPKLKIGPQCTFVGRFLVVEGQRRTYKIHLGSGNILMEPNNQYLCIVPDSRKTSTTDKLFLPFEGDNMLSIILSKAVLLADDSKIKDTTINSQIDHYR